jgi:uncharacterized protein (TIGR02996 family)
MRTFELKGERFWHIGRQGRKITVSYGKLGGKAVSRTTTVPVREVCHRYQAQIAAKLKDGYVETTRDDLPRLDATGQALEQALVDHPDELAAHMAFADWLSEQTDPRLQARSEFIRTQLALEAPDLPDNQRRQLRRREKQLLDAHERDWLGWRLADVLLDGGDDWLHITGLKPDDIRGYARGWLDRLRLPQMGAPTAQALRESPSLRLLRQLSVSDGVGAVEVLGELADSPYLGNVRVLEVVDEVVSENEFLCDLVAGLPRLEELHLSAFEFEAGRLFGMKTMGRLRMLHVEEAAEYRLRALANNSSLGRLTCLELEPGWASPYQGAYIELADVRALVRSRHLNSLTQLRIWRTDAGDAGVREIVQSGILSRLAELDLSHGCITDEGAAALAAAPDYAHLRKLVLHDNRLTAAGLGALQREGLTLEADHQQQPIFDGQYGDAYLYDDMFYEEFDDLDWE